MTDNYYSRIDYTYRNSNIFTVPFDYIRQSDIHVFINKVETENFIFHTSSQIQIQETLTTNDIITIQRITPIEDRDVVFTNTSILNKETQNLANEQVFYGLQEIKDDNEYSSASAKNQADRAAQEAAAAEQKAIDASNSVELARKWAIQIPDAIEGNLHSAKYYASLFSETGQVRSDFTETDTNMASYIVGRDNIADKDFIYSKTTNCILEAPDGILQAINSNETLKLPKNMIVMSGNGTKLNGSLNNYITTTTSTLTVDIPSGATGFIIVFLAIAKNGESQSLVYRRMDTQYYWQTTQPVPENNEATWYNPHTNIWKNITQSMDWYETYRVPVGYAYVKSGKIIILKPFKPLRFISYSDRITNFNQADLKTYKTLSYDTVFKAPMDGQIYINTHIRCNSNSSTASGAEIRGLVGDKVTHQVISNGTTIENTLDEVHDSEGVYSLNIPATGYYKIWLVGGGGNGNTATAYLTNGQAYANGGSGGAGSYFYGEVYLTQGTHTVIVGGAGVASSIDNLVIAGNGTNGSGQATVLGTGTRGEGGTVTINGTVRNYTSTSGNAGNAFTGDITFSQTVAGGASVFKDGYYGAGGSSANRTGTVGYFAIKGTYQTTSTEETTITEGVTCYRHNFSITSTNNVSGLNVQSDIIPIYEGQQFVLYTHTSENSPTIQSAIRFNPCNYNTREKI